MGDFNMTKIAFDSLGPSPLIHGRRLEAWRLLTTRLYLTNAYFIPCNFKGTRFTKREIHQNRLDQSILDRLINNKAQWIHTILQLEHIQDQTLSKHNPITLTVQLVASPKWNHKFSRSQHILKLTRSYLNAQPQYKPSKRLGKHMHLSSLMILWEPLLFLGNSWEIDTRKYRKMLERQPTL